MGMNEYNNGYLSGLYTALKIMQMNKKREGMNSIQKAIDQALLVQWEDKNGNV